MKIKFPENSLSTRPTTGSNLGIVRLGRAAGKTKYVLLDERDLRLIQKLAFEPRIELDMNGGGATIYAFAYDILKGPRSGRYVHNLLWELHCGGIAPGWKVVHLNQVTVDNRLKNLALVPQGLPPSKLSSTVGSHERSLYWVSIQQLPIDPLDEFSDYIVRKPNALDMNGESCIDDDDLYYECRYPPCTNIEKELRQFSICGRCQEARYCGTFCQQKDWAMHKKFCRERRRPPPLMEFLPER